MRLLNDLWNNFMRIACIQYKSYEEEKKTLKKLIPLIYSAAKKKLIL